MSTAFFKSKTHYVDSSYIRQYPHALAGNQEEALKIAVKQYVPLDNISPRPGDVTLIAAHANGVGKELYEPLWDDLLLKSKHSKSFRIRSIWMADCAWQGESGVLNEDKLGDDPSWYDHPRDLLHFINLFRKELPRPLVGVGHSMGGMHVVNLALMHPRLLSGLILVDPVIQLTPAQQGNESPALLSTFRRDTWASRQEAEAAFRRNKFYQGWDPRCLEQWIKYGLRELPTAIYPTYEPTVKAKGPPSTSSPASLASSAMSADALIARPVTLTTTKYQEVYTFARGNYAAPGESLEAHQPGRTTHPDIRGLHDEKPFYRPEAGITFENLPSLRPPVLYITASERSSLIDPASLQQRLEITGTGVSGSGGAKVGAVQLVDIKKAGHFVPFEKPGEVADTMSRWLDGRLEAWKREEDVEREQWSHVSDRQKQTFTEERLHWSSHMKELLSKQAAAEKQAAVSKSSGAKL